MANSKVIGISVSKGKYEGHDFKNLILHTVRKDTYTEGERAEQIKYKSLNGKQENKILHYIKLQN